MPTFDSPLGPPALPPADAPGAGQPRSLLLDDEVLIHLRDLPHPERVALYSVPGRLPELPGTAQRTQAWSHAVPLPSDPRALTVLQIDPRTRELYLAEVWPREALDPATLGRRLDEHRARHREWRAALARVSRRQGRAT